MKLHTKAILTCLLLALTSSTAFAALSQFTGSWRNIKTNTSGITSLQIDVNGTNVTVHAWGKCQPKDCDWGAVQGYAYSATVSEPLPTKARAITAVFKTGFSETILVLHPEMGNRLRGNVYTRFTDNSGRNNYTGTEQFVRRKQTLAEDCIGFDYRKARLQQVNGSWKITVGKMWLKDFGTKRAEAENALKIIQHYRMNKQCFVGRPNPSMEYYLVNNHGPSGAMAGEDCVGFNPAQITVSQINNSWKIVEGSHWILDFGAKEDEANKALDILKHYGFTHSCFVGRPQPSMTYFRR